MAVLYDTIGLNYSELRKPDIRIAAQIDLVLGEAVSVLNVGAGAGSYEPMSRKVTAIEPSIEMIKQRPVSNVNVVQGSAESLPFEDNSFDASMAILTIHHWSNQEAGIDEILRVTRGPVVILTFDPFANWFWLADYFPAFIELDKQQMPPISKFEEWFSELVVKEVPIPDDCADGFLAAYWKRPHAYLDRRVRAAISSFSAIRDLSEGLAKLTKDLKNGDWQQRYGYLLEQNELDCGYRLIVGR